MSRIVRTFSINTADYFGTKPVKKKVELMKFEQMLGVVAIGLLSWGSLQIYQINAQMAVVSYKVEEIYKMIKPMWQDFLRRGGRVAER